MSGLGPTYGNFSRLKAGPTNVSKLSINSVEVTATPAALNVLDGSPANVTAVVAAGAANIADVAISVRDAAGDLIANPQILDVWLSDATTGAGLTGVTASGTVQAKSASGTDLQAVTAKKHLRVQTLATGVYTLEITDTAKTHFKVCVAHPLTGKTIVVATLATASYGSA